MKKNIIMFSTIVSITLSPVVAFGANNTDYMQITTSTVRILENGTKMAFDEGNNNSNNRVSEIKNKPMETTTQSNDINEYYIAPESEVKPNLTLPRNDSKTFKLKENMYYKVGNNNLISLGVLKSHLGMELKLNEDRTMDILSKEGRIATIYLDENKYIDSEKVTTLSTQPILVNGLDMSVPFDFFSKILNATITTDRQGTITINYNK